MRGARVAPMGRSYKNVCRSAPWARPRVCDPYRSHPRIDARRCDMDSRSGHRALRRGRTALPNHVYHLTVTTQGRTPFFDDFAAACAAAACFEDPVLLGDSRMLAWVLMPDHAHWLLQLGESAGLIATVSRLKSASSRAANKTLGRNGHLWSSAFHDRALRRDRESTRLNSSHYCASRIPSSA